MKSASALCLPVVVLGFAAVLDLVHARRETRLKAQTPDLIKKQQHTNVVHYPTTERKDSHSDHHQHHQYYSSYHHDDGDGHPLEYHHSHDFGHKLSFTHGDDNFEVDHVIYDGQKKKPKSRTQKPKKASKKLPTPKKYYSAGESFNFSPNSKTKHVQYSSVTPSFSNTDEGTKHSIRHESLKIETTKNIQPDEDGFDRFTTTLTGGYQEPILNNFEDKYENYDKIPSFGSYYNNAAFSLKDESDDNHEKELGDYREDYTNPNSVAKYTANVHHGSIGLEDSSYNADHGNDLEEYISAGRKSLL